MIIGFIKGRPVNRDTSSKDPNYCWWYEDIGDDEVGFQKRTLIRLRAVFTPNEERIRSHIADQKSIARTLSDLPGKTWYISKEPVEIITDWFWINYPGTGAIGDALRKNHMSGAELRFYDMTTKWYECERKVVKEETSRTPLSKMIKCCGNFGDPIDPQDRMYQEHL